MLTTRQFTSKFHTSALQMHVFGFIGFNFLTQG